MGQVQSPARLIALGKVRNVLFAACAAGLAATAAHAAPYASEIVANGNNVSFVLNEAADKVQVIYNGTAHDLSTAAGSQSFTLPSASTPYQIVVSKSSSAGWLQGAALQIGSDTATTSFNAPRGVAVNQNPGQYFGRVYVTNDAGGVVNSPPGQPRTTTGAGVYVLHADQTDALAQGNAALDAGLTTPFANANSPWHLSVGPDNNVYIGDIASAGGNIYRTGPNVTGGTNLLFGTPGNSATNAATDNHGRIYSRPVVSIDGTGKVSILATDGDLNSDGKGFNAIRRYDLGVNPTAPTAAVPQTFISNPTAAPNANGISTVQGVTTSIDVGPTDGRIYYVEDRSAGGQPGLFVVKPSDGSIMYDSLTDTQRLTPGATADMAIALRAVKVSPDNKYVAAITEGNAIDIIPLDATIGGVSGLPDLAAMKTITNAFPDSVTLGRDIDFDAAGNIYAVSSGDQLMRVISPGGDTSFTTAFDGANLSFSPTAVPEPAALSLLGVGASALIVRRRRRGAR
jgi:hypothetical protein